MRKRRTGRAVSLLLALVLALGLLPGTVWAATSTVDVTVTVGGTSAVFPETADTDGYTLTDTQTSDLLTADGSKIGTYVVKTYTKTTAGSTAAYYWQYVDNGVSGIEDGKSYLIVSGSSGSVYALSNTGDISGALTVSSGTISVDDVAKDSAYVFTLEDAGDNDGSTWYIGSAAGYLYPDAVYEEVWFSKQWNYSIASEQTEPRIVTIAGNGSVTVVSTTSNTDDDGSTTISGVSFADYSEYFNYITFGADESPSELYLFELVEVPNSDGTTETITTVEFTGGTPGTTSVTVGDVTYNITVNPLTEVVSLTAGSSKSYTVTGTVSDADIIKFNEDNGTYVKAELSGDQLVFTGQAAGTVTDILGNTEYTITVTAADEAISLGIGAENAQTVTPIGAADKIKADIAALSTDLFTVTYDETANTLTFTGLNEGGPVDVTIGGTVYTVTTAYTEQTITVTEGNTYSIGNVTEYTDGLNGAYASASLSDGTLTITGVAAGEAGTVIVGGTRYTVRVEAAVHPIIGSGNQYTNAEVKKLTISEGLTYDLDLSVSGSTVTWSSADESIATVDEDGTVTAKAAGTTEITCTIDGEKYTIPVTVMADAVSDTYGICDLYIADVINCTVVYSINLSTDFTETQSGEVIYRSFDPKFCLNFFSVGHSGYALSYMAVTNSLGNYYQLSGDPANADSLEAYDAGAISNQRGYWSDAEALTMLQAAITKGYTGTTGFTRGTNDTGAIEASLTFVAQSLPSMTKEIRSVTGKDGTVRSADKDGNWGIKVNDTVTYEIKLTIPAALRGDSVSYGTIDYSAFAMTDVLSFNGKQITLEELGGKLEFEKAVTASGTEVAASMDTDTIITSGDEIIYVYYTASFDMTYDNYEKLYISGETAENTGADASYITNTANLTYTYQSSYAKGSSSNSANADIIAYMWYDSYVIDFGRPVEIEVSVVDHFETAEAKYGTVEIVKKDDGSATNTLIYTPTEIAYGYDVITYRAAYNGTDATSPIYYGLYVTSASNVLYEEGFIAVGTGSFANWSGGSMIPDNSANQSSSNTAPYGYDAVYAASTGLSGSAYTTTVHPDSIYSNDLTFSFFGTGFDVIGTCGPNTGALVIEVYQNETARSLTIVDTVYNDGAYGPIYQVPLAHIVLGTEDAEYTVKMRAFYPIWKETEKADKTLEIDGIRIYRTTDAASYKEVNPNSTTDKGIEYNVTYYNVLDALNAGSITAYVENKEDGTWSVDQYEASGGPQNEVYLAPNQSIAFKMVGGVNPIQVSVRNVSDKYAAKLNGTAITHATEMYYSVGTTNGVVVITNTGTGLLAVCNLKYPDGSTVAAIAMEDEPAVFALLRSGGSPVLDTYASAEPEDPVQPEAPVEPEIPETPFADIDGHWAEKYITAAYQAGLVYGTSATTYKPDSYLTRGSFITLLYRLNGSPTVDGENPFADVPADTWYTDAVIWGYRNGIVYGKSADTFDPSGNITRQELVVMLMRYAGFTGRDVSGSADLSRFHDDEQVASWAADGMKWAVAEDLVGGRDGNLLAPSGLCNRAEAATILVRFADVESGGIAQ